MLLWKTAFPKTKSGFSTSHNINLKLLLLVFKLLKPLLLSALSYSK